MQGLFQKVVKGVYPKIPPQFSSDLGAMIKALLTVDPKNRPNCKQIIHMPVFIAKYNEIREEKAKEFIDEPSMNDNLLGTIKVPKNLRLLSERLPKSNYGLKPKKEKKENDVSCQSVLSVSKDQLQSI
jgi:NIMA (never in mitosis gene a)-related kinase 1/4/5